MSFLNWSASISTCIGDRLNASAIKSTGDVWRFSQNCTDLQASAIWKKNQIPQVSALLELS